MARHVATRHHPAMHWMASIIGIGVTMATLRFFYRRILEGSGDILVFVSDPMSRSMATFFVGVALAAGVLSFHGTMLVAGWIATP